MHPETKPKTQSYKNCM